MPTKVPHNLTFFGRLCGEKSLISVLFSNSYAEKAVSHIDGTAYLLSLTRFKSTVCELVYFVY